MESPSASQISELVTQKLHNLDLVASKDREFTLEVDQVESSVAWEVVERISERLPVRPTYDSENKKLRLVLNSGGLHQAPLSWVVHVLGGAYANEVLAPQEWEHLLVSSNRTYRACTKPFIGSVVQPDIFVRNSSSQYQYPNIVFEVGWTETMDNLYRNRDILLHGFKGYVNLVILIKWTLSQTTANMVEGILEVWELNYNGIPNCRQREVIFPAPAPGSTPPQAVKVSKAELFANSTVTVQDPKSEVVFPLNVLRRMAVEEMKFDGYLPA